MWWMFDIFLNFFIWISGGEIGYLSGLQGNTEKVMCSLGYDNIFSGLCSALVD